MTEPLEGRVATIISVRELSINRGASDGVREGMAFAVLADTALRVEDPDTGEFLGEIDREKVRVKATQVSERFSICRTYETYKSLSLLAPFPPLVGTRQVRTLKSRTQNLLFSLPEEESYVKVGDRVRQVASED